MTKITRVEVIDENGRSYVNFEDDNDVSVSYQDDGRTLKVFVNKIKPEPQTLFDVIRNLGYSVDMCYEIVDAVEAFQKSKENEQGTWNYDPDAKFRKQEEVKKLQEKEWKVDVKTEWHHNEWKSVALHFGEELVSISPYGYYDFTPDEWLEWVINTYEKLCDDTVNLLKQKKVKKRKIDDLAEKLLPDDHPYKIADEHGETNPYLQYLNSVKEWEPKPQEPEEVAEGLRSAMRTAIKEGIIPEVKQPTDELIDELVKNPPEFLKFELGKTLEDIVNRWWEDTFTIHETWSTEECISDLVDQIQLWLPKEQSAAGSQSLGVEELVEGFNDCLKKIKSKLRNKK
jgi:hypothetical protein